MKITILQRQTEVDKAESIKKGQTFNTFSEAQKAIDAWSKDGYHPIHVERSEKFIDSNKVLQEKIVYSRITYSCVHFGTKRQSKSKLVRPSQHYLRIGCPMAVHLRYDRKEEKLCVTKVVDEHNHPVSQLLFRQYARNRRPNAEERAEIERLVQLKVSPSTLKTFVAHSHGKHLKLKDIHNIKQKVKQSGSQSAQSEAEMVENIVENLKEKRYAAEILLDDSGHVQMLYIQSPEMCRTFERNPNTVFVDSIGETSGHGYTLRCLAVENEHGAVEHVSYAFLQKETEQLLSKVCSLFKQGNPGWQKIKIVFVNTDATAIKVLQENFVEAKVLLCSFHVIKLWKKSVAELLLTKEQRKHLLSTLCSMMYSETLQRYDSHMQKLKDRCPDKEFVEYFLMNWDVKKEMWAHAFRRDLPTFENEKIESHFQKQRMFLSPDLSVLESLVELIRIIDSQESEKSFKVPTMSEEGRYFNIEAEELQKSDSSQVSVGQNDEDNVERHAVTCRGAVPSAPIVPYQKNEDLSLKNSSLFHPRWHRVGVQSDMEVGKHLSESLQPPLKPLKDSMGRYDTVLPVAMEVAALIASSGAKEYERMFQTLQQLLHSWKLNRKVVLLEIDQMSETTSRCYNRDAAHVDEDVMMVTSECTERESKSKMHAANVDDTKVMLGIRSVKKRSYKRLRCDDSSKSGHIDTITLHQLWW